jgi:hypothetical protein
MASLNTKSLLLPFFRKEDSFFFSEEKAEPALREAKTLMSCRSHQ